MNSVVSNIRVGLVSDSRVLSSLQLTSLPTTRMKGCVGGSFIAYLLPPFA